MLRQRYRKDKRKKGAFKEGKQGKLRWGGGGGTACCFERFANVGSDNKNYNTILRSTHCNDSVPKGNTCDKEIYVHVMVVLSMSGFTKQLKIPSHVPCHSWPISPMYVFHFNE